MSYTNVYPTRINWENEPSISSPINATNLNKIDYAVYQHDRTLETWDTTKANQSDLLLSVKSIDYDTDTGVFVFTWQNGTTKTVDLNIEKIPVSFSMDANGVITMTTDDGTQYTADVGALIKTYTFTDSSEIDFTVTTDASGNKTITAGLVSGSITGDKLEPNYLANCQSAANSASGSATAADGSAEDSEAWAVGERGGVPVPSTDPAYENNAKWYAEHGTGSSLVGLSDTDITNPADGQVLTYNSTTKKWENDDPQAGGGSKITITTSDSGLYNRPVTLSDGTTTLTGTFSNSGEVTFEGVTITGTLTVSSSTSGGTSTTMTIQVPYFGNYEFELTNFSATITVTYTTGATCTCVGQGESYTATSNPQTFTVHHAGTYVVTVSKDGDTATENVTITTDGQSESITIDLVPEGSTVTPTDIIQTWLKCAGITDKAYTTLSQVLADTETFDTLLRDSNACDYMARSTTWATTIVADSSAMSRIGKYDYCANTLLANSTWHEAICESDYFESVLNAKVPVMTSNTTPIGVASASHEYNSNYAAWKAFDGNTSSAWGGNNSATTEWLQYKFAEPIVVNVVAFATGWSGTGLQVGDFKIQASNDDGSTWIDLYSGTVENSQSLSNVIQYRSFENNTAYSIYRMNMLNSHAGVYFALSTLQFYGRKVSSANTKTQIHSCPEDTIYYMSNGSQVTLCTTNTDGIGEVDWTDFDPGNITLYSTVAKDPSILSSDYSKTIKTTKTMYGGTTDAYLMPENTLYWYGFEGDSFEECSTANGWTAASGYSFTSPTYNKNYIGLVGVTNKHCGVGSKTTTNGKLNAITQGLTAAMNVYGEVGRDNIKNVGTGTIVTKQVTSSSLSKVTEDTTQSENYYNFAMATNARSFNLYALWYE